MFDAKNFLKTVPNRPGSYRMYDKDDTVIYVGKAKDLKKRLSSYFLKTLNSSKTIALVANIAHIEFTVTFSEAEALILENELIKKYQPKYNILLRDDKSYPYILLTKDKHPALFYHRGPKRKAGDYFGPYPDSSAVKDSLRLMQKIFPIRQCKDNVYLHRSRPCLYAQLGKCLAPCVFKTKEEEERYSIEVENVKLFLKGKNQELLDSLKKQMEDLSEKLKFEEAAKIRDRIFTLRKVQESQSISTDTNLSLDVIAHDIALGQCCVHVLFIREGRVLGTRSYYPSLPQSEDENVLDAFLAQFYLQDEHLAMLPKEIVLDSPINEEKLITEAIYQKVHKDVKIVTNVKTERQKYLRLAKENAKSSLKAKLISFENAKKRIESLEDILHLSNLNRLECFDISHTQGELTVASCVVFNREGPDSSHYRLFNIEGITKGDDFAAMRQVLTRRFKNIENITLPDLVFIDGGLGQLHVAEEVFDEIFMFSDKKAPFLVGVAKGEGRKEGLETLILGYSHESFNLTLADPALQLVLHIRDESHRFAITGHRDRRAKARRTSTLESIDGVGAKRRQALLKHFGGRQELMASGVDEIAKVPGISANLAQKIYDALHLNS